MRFERLVIEAEGRTCTLELHPRLTVVAGVGPLERDGLIAELQGALSGGRSGLHLEVVDDGGRRLAVARPAAARSRVVDVDGLVEVTDAFRADDGGVDLLAPSGLDRATARRRLRFGATDLTSASLGAALVRRLAAADPQELWAAADTVSATDEALRTEAEALGSAPEDVTMVEQVEARHGRAQAAQARHERFRKVTLALSALCGAGAVGAVVLDARLAALVSVFVALLAMLSSVVTRGRLERARRAERNALAGVGASSYLGFHLQRVNGMLSDEAGRRRLLVAAETNHRALARWREVAGDVSVEWARERREEVAAAARVRIDITTHATLANDPAEGDDDATTDLARMLVGRLAELRRLGGGAESYPLLLDDPFAAIDRTAKPALLELLSHTSGTPQLVYLTDDEDVASWARLEALTGALSIIEPAATVAAPAANRR
jgi:hypothetical protein